jgi:hypothetical protein
MSQTGIRRSSRGACPNLGAVPGLSALERRCVVPFYLTMMRLNALSYDVPFDTLREVTRQTTDEEVAQLLGSPWRPRVMGAWLASGRTPRLEAALLKSLETSAGSLTAPPLATVALHGWERRPCPRSRLTCGGTLSTSGARPRSFLPCSNDWTPRRPVLPSMTRTARP